MAATKPSLWVLTTPHYSSLPFSPVCVGSGFTLPSALASSSPEMRCWPFTVLWEMNLPLFLRGIHSPTLHLLHESTEDFQHTYETWGCKLIFRLHQQLLMQISIPNALWPYRLKGFFIKSIYILFLTTYELFSWYMHFLWA